MQKDTYRKYLTVPTHHDIHRLHTRRLTPGIRSQEGFRQTDATLTDEIDIAWSHHRAGDATRGGRAGDGVSIGTIW